jgi:hypothetical protein
MNAPGAIMIAAEITSALGSRLAAAPASARALLIDTLLLTGP